MTTQPQASSNSGPTRSRGKSRGSRGKYLRARGRRGLGRPAEFGKRLFLPGEGPDIEDEVENEGGEEDDESANNQSKYSRRQLGTNVDRYIEPEPELGSDGEPIVQPEVDISTFLEKQRTSNFAQSVVLNEDKDKEDDSDVDESLGHIGSQATSTSRSIKPKLKQVEWDSGLDEMSRDKAAAEATWDMKAKFKARSERLRAKPAGNDRGERQAGKSHLVEAPPLPGDRAKVQKAPEEEMEDFLDDLLG